jgi:transcriptional regulator with XRE-family HTH domain
MFLGIDDHSIIGNFLKGHRKNSGLSQKEVSDILGYSSSQFISNIERGVAGPPTDVFLKMVSIYKIPEKQVVDFLISEQKKALSKLFKKRKKAG